MPAIVAQNDVADTAENDDYSLEVDQHGDIMVDYDLDESYECMSESAVVSLSEESTEESSSESDSASGEDDPPATGHNVAPNGTSWAAAHARTGREGQHNIFTATPGFRRGLHPLSREEAFEIFFEGCLDIAALYTNLAGKQIARNRGIAWKKIERQEFNAFIGLHLLAGAYKSTHRNTAELWSESDGHPLFRATMSFERFKQIKSALRFDDKRIRDRNDSLAPIRQVVDTFNASLRANYEPGPFLTMDEQLIEFHGRVKFRRYVPTKPGKYGMLLYWLTEADTSFPLSFLVYNGQETLTASEKASSSSIPEALTMKLAAPYLDKGRNITMDNYFTSLPLAKRMLGRKTTIVGTLRGNRREVPEAAKCVRNRKKGDTVHFFHENITLCSYWDKKNKPVLLLSSMHRQPPNRTEGKSDVVLCYNETKSGVDNLDKLTRTYRSQRKCRRWPYGIYFTLVDVAVIAALKLWTKTTDETHYVFKKELAKSLCMPLVYRRALLPGLNATVKTAMRLIGVDIARQERQETTASQGRCYLCPRGEDRKSRIKCSVCDNFVCPSHRDNMIACQSCADL